MVGVGADRQPARLPDWVIVLGADVQARTRAGRSTLVYSLRAGVIARVEEFGAPNELAVTLPVAA